MKTDIRSKYQAEENKALKMREQQIRQKEQRTQEQTNTL